MIGWTMIVLIVALVAAVLGFAGVAGSAMATAQVICLAALILCLVSAVFGVMRGRSPRV